MALRAQCHVVFVLLLTIFTVPIVASQYGDERVDGLFPPRAGD